LLGIRVSTVVINAKYLAKNAKLIHQSFSKEKIIQQEVTMIFDNLNMSTICGKSALNSLFYLRTSKSNIPRLHALGVFKTYEKDI